MNGMPQPAQSRAMVKAPRSCTGKYLAPLLERDGMKEDIAVE